MSKNITISEGENARAFGNTKKLKTLLQGEDAGSCFWVPEDETQANPTYIMENGLHTAEEAGEYGFSVAHVNVPGKVTDFDGTDWDIIIDEDGIPHIEIDDINIDPDIKITIDDGTGEIDIIIDEETVAIDPEDFDLDPDADIDVSIDPEDLGVDIVGTDLDGDDVIIDLDPTTGDFDIIDCPASIRVVLPPNKTEYTDGDSIDLTGLYVYAYNADGSVFRGGKYRDGRVPNSELSLDDTIADIEKADGGGEAIANGNIPAIVVKDGQFLDNTYTTYHGEVITISNYFRTTPAGGYVLYNQDRSGYISSKNGPGVSNHTVVGITEDGQTFGYGAITKGETHGLSIPVSDIPISSVNIETVDEINGQQEIKIHWNSPCGMEVLSASFEISVFPSGGQVVNEGETTISGNYGGSHYSGKF